MNVSVANPADVITGTVNEFAARWGVDYAAASGYINVLKSKGIVIDAGSRPTATGKGKPAKLFSIPKSFTVENQ